LKASRAAPPPPLPRGFFDTLAPVVKTLLDNGLALAQAADWLIENRALRQPLRQRFLNAMRSRFTRCRWKDAKAGEVFRWKSSLAYDAAHAIGRSTVALCGAKTGCWMGATDTTRKCPVCAGIVRKQNITMNRE
jgi:hypothetical protein